MFTASGILTLLFFVAPTRTVANPSNTAWTVLRAGLTDSDPIKRSEALTATESIGPVLRAILLIEKGLADKDPLVRQTAATVLGQMRSRRAIPKLTQALSDQVPSVRLVAAKSLWELGDHRCRNDLMDILSGQQKTSNPFIKTEIQTAERDIHDPSALVRIGITQGAGAFLGPYGMGLGIAEDMFKDQDAVGRALAASLLAHDSSPKSFNALEEALLDNDSGVRAAAARALGMRSERSALPDLVPLLYDKSPAPRFMAAAAIIRLNLKRGYKHILKRH